MRAGRGPRRLVGRSHLGGAADAVFPRRWLHTQGGAHHPEGHHAEAQFRHRADAIWQAVPGWRFRAYRAADRGEGPQPRGRGYRDAGPRAGGVLSAWSDGAAGRLFGDLSRPHLEGAAAYVVDDLDAASFRDPWRIRAARAA